MSNGENKDQDLSARINALKLKRSGSTRTGRTQETASGWAKGTRMATDLVAGVIVGGLVGYWLDQWLGTNPWLFLICLMFGFAAGIMNVVRSAQRMAQSSEPKETDDLDPGSEDDGQK